MSEDILITNVQRFSLHDGPGIRSTVFLKGCSLRCPWCSNPENLQMRIQTYIKDGVSGEYGRYVTWQALYQELMKDRMFYAGGGGVTFSGGEPLQQIEQLEPLLMRLKETGVHMCMETSLFAETERLELALMYIDMFYVDMKILDIEGCRRILHGNLPLYNKNLQRLADSAAPVVVRVPVIGGYTDTEDNMERIVEQLKRCPPMKVELLKEHHLGAKKYESLGLPVPTLSGVLDERLEHLREMILKTGIPVEVCRI